MQGVPVSSGNGFGSGDLARLSSWRLWGLSWPGGRAVAEVRGAIVVRAFGLGTVFSLRKPESPGG